MSDLLSPVLYVMENEVDAFWCFVSYMDQMVKIICFFLPTYILKKQKLWVAFGIKFVNFFFNTFKTRILSYIWSWCVLSLKEITVGW